MINNTNSNISFAGCTFFRQNAKSFPLEQLKKNPIALEMETKKLETMHSAIMHEMNFIEPSLRNKALLENLKTQATKLEYKINRNKIALY